MSSFRFLDLPDELRLKLYRFILPCKERIHLDPDNVLFPIPYIVEESYGSTINILQVCKKIHHEATQFIYEHNLVNIIDTTDPDIGDFLEGLGLTACRYISKLECHVTEGLGDLGDIWATMAQCPRLTDIRLVFYHERSNWIKTLAQIGWHMQVEEKNKDKNKEEGRIPLTLDLEMHNSIWAPRYQHHDYREQFDAAWKRAEKQARVYQFQFPSQLRHITITASVIQTAKQGLVSWTADSSPMSWGFRTAEDNDTEQKKTIRFARFAQPQDDDD